MFPRIQGLEHCISSDGFFDLEHLPKKVAIVGAGYIGVELAGVLNGMGVDTTMFIRQDHVLRGFDTLIQNGVMESYKKHGVKVW